MIYAANYDDKEILFKMVNRRIEELFDQFMSADPSTKVIYRYEDKGLIVGTVLDTPVGKMASDVLWWVAPEHRHNNIGSALLDAFESWAKDVGCTFVSMSSLDPNTGKEFFQNRGYIFQGGLTYIKVL